MKPPPLSVAVAVHTFPVLSETFVIDHIIQLIDQGHDVDVLALYRGEPAAAHPAVAEYGLEERTRFLIDDRPTSGPVRKLGRGATRIIGHGGRLPWLRVIGESVRVGGGPKRSAELVLAALGATAASGASGRLAYDVVHAHNGGVGLVVQRLRAWGLVEGPLVTTFHGSDVLVHARRNPGMYDPLFSGADLLTTNTRFLLRELQRLGAPAERCEVVPVGVDPSELEFRERWLEPGAPLRVLTVARLDPLKGLDYGTRAIHRLREAGIDARYTIVGAGPDRDRLKDLIESLGLQDAVRLLGGQTWDRVLEAYANHDVFMLPGVESPTGGREAQGRVLVEAQAVGMPVVSTRVGGTPEAVAPGAGVLVAQRDPGALAAALQELYEASTRWGEMGRKGRELVEREFDSRRLTAELVQRYRGLTRSSRREQPS